MLAVISPAKSLDYDSPLATAQHSEPRLLEHTNELVSLLQRLSLDQIATLMHISPKLAALNVQRYQDYDDEPGPDAARAAVLAFNGDVYQGLTATSFTEDDFVAAQASLRILSGLYGLLRPLDRIQPYRLEMGTKLATPRGRNLYEWWGSLITDLLRDDVTASPGEDALINLASQEYSKAVDTEALGLPVVAPRFEDRDRNGRPRVVALHAKRARGAMAAWLIKNRVRSVRELSQFDGLGYRHDAERSTIERPIFVR
ncbi:MAG: peroxide stress protein YaaA [Arachnia propionica]|nr:MAG: peroxide stress protein YaaA [Arachnia propionica]